MLCLQAKYDVELGKLSKADEESTSGCVVISITVILTLIFLSAAMLPILFIFA